MQCFVPGIPQIYYVGLLAGENDDEAMVRSAEVVLQRLDLPNRVLLAYLSRTGPVKGLGPGTEVVIRELGAAGVPEILVIPLSFVSDHIETLYEIDLLFAETARKAGIEGYYRPEALNTHPLFIDALAGLVDSHLRDGAAEPTAPVGAAV